MVETIKVQVAMEYWQKTQKFEKNHFLFSILSVFGS